MKKILALFLLCSVTTLAQAKIVVPIVWPFALSSSSGIQVREIVTEANTIQNKYQFVFEHRPGAGGAVGVNHVINANQPVLLVHTSSFFIRPYMVKEGSYDPEQFILINNYCSDQPLALLSKNFKTLVDLQKQTKISVGVIPGSITTLPVAEYKKQNLKFDLIEVGFKGTPEITTAVLGGHLDVSIDFLSPTVRDINELNVLAITGTKNYGNARTFQSQGLNGYELMTISYYLLMHNKTDPAVVKELNDIMVRAVANPRVQKLCTQDFGTVTTVSGADAQALLDKKHQFWRKSVEKFVK
jgi:tripartite-type tricarboxylate transporter receptor subunit TctC